ncbi:MAG: YkgJ family cysteine cluster protein [Kofleriaceae bacterium]|nr:YkgJ family cysteine cluster protein [Kofleriaceae bacterium]MCB9570751.1 YkgJ family cysteine cluster protein [Kofleriaceae bacterium]
MTRLDDVLDDLAHAAQGKRRLPVLQPDDVVAVYALFHGQVDRGTARRAALVTEGGHVVACQPGCDACCHNTPAIHAGEAVTIARWLEQPAQAAARDAFLTRYPAWRAALGDLVDRWAHAAGTGDVATEVELAAAAWHRTVPCAFLDGGRCSIYPVRPVVCRDHHALGTAAACQPGAQEDLQRARFPPLVDYLDHIRPIVLAMHDALQPDTPGARPLCAAVHDQLAPDDA